MFFTRGFRWLLFLAAALSFFYVMLGGAEPWAVALFFVSGALWYALERRKMRELDAYRPK